MQTKGIHQVYIAEEQTELVIEQFAIKLKGTLNVEVLCTEGGSSGGTNMGGRATQVWESSGMKRASSQASGSNTGVKALDG